MDRKAIIVLVASVILLILWFPLMNRIYPPPPTPHPPAEDPVKPDRDRPTAVIDPAPDRPPPVMKDPEQPEELVRVENDQVIYTFTSHGGGIKLIELKEHPEHIVCRRGEEVPDRLASLNKGAPMPALALLAGEELQEDGIFTLSTTRDDRVFAEKLLANGLHLVKEFRIGTNFLFTTDVRIENRSNEPITLPEQEWVVGTATPLGAGDEAHLMGAFWFDGSRAEHIKESWFANRFLVCFPGTPRSEYRAGMDDVIWAAVHNQFFTLAAIPEGPAPRVSIRRVNLPAPTQETLDAYPRAARFPYGFQTAFVYPQQVLRPGETVSRQYTIYAGPKEYNTLARLGRQFDEIELDRVMGFGGFFGFFSQFLLVSMAGLHNLFGFGYAAAIICITVIIKLVFWPLTNASTRSMKRMAALQPQMKALQEKYKDDPKKMNQKLMEFMRENKVNPMGSCLPLLLQLPIFIGFYKMLMSAIELRGATFLWACDLSQPDTVAMIPGLNFPINPLPLIMGVTMLFQARMTPMAPTMDPVQQKMFKYMPLIFIVILYNMSAGLVLYWTVQNLLTILQMKVTKTHQTIPPAAGPGKTPAGPVKPVKPHRPGGRKKR